MVTLIFKDQVQYSGNNTHANYVNGIRAVREENDKSPIFLLTFRQTNLDNWAEPNPENVQDGSMGYLSFIPYIRCQWNGPVYFKKGGFYGVLDQIPESYPDKISREPLVLLTPFHLYLEPLLVNELGGVRVRDVYPAESTAGPSQADFGFAPFSGPTHRLIRLKGFTRERLHELEERWMFAYTAEELTPPSVVGTRESLNKYAYHAPEYLQALQNYVSRPSGWKAGKKTKFSLPDIYFWITDKNMPDGISVPLRLKADWLIRIPEDGNYSFGASASVYTALFADGKKIFSYVPDAAEKLGAGVEGFLGDPIFLKAGAHRLKVEQVALSSVENFNHAIRLLWQKPGGVKETLPLEVLEPGKREEMAKKP